MTFSESRLRFLGTKIQKWSFAFQQFCTDWTASAQRTNPQAETGTPGPESRERGVQEEEKGLLQAADLNQESGAENPSNNCPACAANGIKSA